MPKKIVAIGPEGAGKSTLCEQLAQHYETMWCPEFARAYLLTNGTKYSFDDLLIIARGQLSLEDEIAAMAHHNKPLFIDTDMYVMKVWCEFVFGKCHRFILEQIAVRKYDLYLLCQPDLPWVQDELREYPDPETRQVLFKMYKDHLVHQKVPWVEISGSAAERMTLALAAVEKIIRAG